MDIRHGRNFVPPAVMEKEEALILVVGNDSECKSRFADAIARARGATLGRTTKAGVRIFTKNSSPAVMETVELRTIENWQRMDTARLWISQNSLRKLAGKLVFMVCIITCKGPEDEIYQEKNFGRNRFSWLHLVACICGEKMQSKIMVLVNLADMTNRGESVHRMRTVLDRDGFKKKGNINFVELKTGDLDSSIKLVLERSVYRGEVDVDHHVGHKSDTFEVTTAPFFVQKVPPNAKDDGKYGPWGPQNAILLGRTGSGKSTLAQMLTLGRLDNHKGTNFTTSSGIRGETDSICDGSGRGWRVIDTPGLGESAKDEKSTVPEFKAKRMIKKHVGLAEGTYCHYLYVWKKDRVDELDVRLWSVFMEICGEEMVKKHTTVVVSDADKDWLTKDDNLAILQKAFKGCESFVTADFPPMSTEEGDKHDEELAAELHDVRLESLENLEDELASLCRWDRSCPLGRWSVGTQHSLVSRADFPILQPMFQSGSDGASSSRPERTTAMPDPTTYEMARAFIRVKSSMHLM
ncbi:unnamed protein product [Calypogeia fissa]